MVSARHLETPRSLSIYSLLREGDFGCWLGHCTQHSPAKLACPLTEGAGALSMPLLAPSSASCTAEAPTQPDLVNQTLLTGYLWKPVTILKPSQPSAFCFTQMHLSALIKSKHYNVLCIFTYNPALHCLERKTIWFCPVLPGEKRVHSHTPQHCVSQPSGSPAPPWLHRKSCRCDNAAPTPPAQQQRENLGCLIQQHCQSR